MTPPTKKTTPALKDLLETQKEDSTPVDTEVDNSDLGSVSLVDPNKDHVHTWQEDHDQNLARLQKDAVVASPPSEYARTSVVVDEIVYATPDDNDDTGRSVVVDEEDDVPPNAGSVD